MLKFNKANSSFVLYTKDETRAEEAGLTLSNTVRGPNGENVYYTADYDNKPVFNPYAVLDFYDEADDEAKSYLTPMVKDYQASWADVYDMKPFPVPEGKAYLPYQNAGIAYAIDHGNCVIGDEPGLGKTIQAIGIANFLKAKRVLILCPASIRLNWQREILGWSTLPNVKTYPILKSADGVSPFANYVICSYDLARKEAIHKALMQTEWDMIVCDEAHYLKTLEALRTRAVFGGGEVNSYFYDNGLNKKTNRILGLTGTLLPNRPREAYTIARGLNWEAIDYLSYDKFLYRYNPSVTVFSGNKEENWYKREETRGHVVEERGRLPELNARLRCNLMIRRLKKDVLPQLPDKRYAMTYIEPDGGIREVLAQEALIDFDPKDLFNAQFSLDGTPISTLRRLMGEAMAPRIVEYMKYLFDVVEHEKLVLYAHHTSVINHLAEGLAEYGVVLHTGRQSPMAKQKSIDDFVNSTPRLFLAQLDTMEGVDGLQGVCSNEVFGEPAWTPGRNEQCMDRIHRIGQHDYVIGHFLLVEGSFNEKVLNVVLAKTESIHKSLDNRLI